MQRATAKVFGFLVLGLGLIGLLAGDRQLLDFLNVDVALDITRLGLAALLLYAAYKGSIGTVRTSLIVLGVLYVGLAILGVMDAEVGGLLPSRLSDFDKAFHLLSGLAALGIAARHEESDYRQHPAM